MRIRMTTVGFIDSREIEWPEGWPVPAEGAELFHPKSGPLWVRKVIWNLEGSQDDKEPEPFVYIVVGPTPRDL